MRKITQRTIELKVVGVRYYNTRRGVGYECKTNIDSVRICNDGRGGGTFVDGYKIAVRSGIKRERLDDEWHLESLIDDYEHEQELTKKEE